MRATHTRQLQIEAILESMPKKHVNLERTKEMVHTIFGRIATCQWSDGEMQALAKLKTECPQDATADTTRKALEVLWDNHPLNKAQLMLNKGPRDYAKASFYFYDEWDTPAANRYWPDASHPALILKTACQTARMSAEQGQTLACKAAVCAFCEHMQERSLKELKRPMTAFARFAARNAPAVTKELSTLAEQISLMQCDLMVHNDYAKYALVSELALNQDLNRAILSWLAQVLHAYYDQCIDPFVQLCKE